MEDEEFNSLEEAVESFGKLGWARSLKFLTTVESFDEIEGVLKIEEFVQLMTFLYRLGTRQALSVQILSTSLTEEQVSEINDKANEFLLRFLAKKERDKKESMKQRVTSTGQVLQRIK